MMGQSAILTATEALTLLAFGKPETWEQHIGWELSFEKRWRFMPPASEMLELLEARGGPDPYYPWRPVMSRNGSTVRGYETEYAAPSRWIEGPFGRTRLGAPELARAVRAQHRRGLGRIVSFAELAVMLRVDLDIHRDRLAKWNEANALLRHAILNKEVTAWAVRANDPKQEHVSLPPQVALRAIQFRADQIEPNEDAPMEDFTAIEVGGRWTQVRFDLADIQSLEARQDALQVLDSTETDNWALASPQPFPQTGYVRAWEAITWRAFGGRWIPPMHVQEHRSFDGGVGRRFDETDEQHAKRQEEHRLFDAAEREVFELLASSKARAKGQPPARKASGERLNTPAAQHVDIPGDVFLNDQLGLVPGSKLVWRLPLLARLFPSHELRGSDADPSFPLFFNVLIEVEQLAVAWNPTMVTESEAAGQRPSPEAKRKRRVQGLDYAKSDEPLVRRALKGMADGIYRNALDAARALGKEAQGAGNEDSRTKRLLGRIVKVVQSRSVAE